MGCKCHNDSKKISKYTDGNEQPLEPLRGLRKVGVVAVRIVIGILLFAIIIAVAPFIVIYLIINLLLGRETKINLKKLFRLNGRQ